MELNIVNPDAEVLYRSLGIPENRRFELEQKMKLLGDELMLKEKFKMYMIVDAIAKFCDNVEELTYCTFVHAWWLGGRRQQILQQDPDLRNKMGN